jgi:phosphatidylserine decarboxylase
MRLVKDGLPLVLTPIGVAALILLAGFGGIYIFIAIVLILSGMFFAYFFRDPKREISRGDNLVLSPCDGTVMEIVQENDFNVIRVFLSIFNVHLQRAPVAGVVKEVIYTKGKYLPAMDPKAHKVNEQNLIIIQAEKGIFKVKQISGILARRIVCFVKPGDKIEPGQKIGFIKFGSQVDLYVPKSAEIEVKPGDKVHAGLTIFGKTK